MFSILAAIFCHSLASAQNIMPPVIVEPAIGSRTYSQRVIGDPRRPYRNTIDCVVKGHYTYIEWVSSSRTDPTVLQTKLNADNPGKRKWTMGELRTKTVDGEKVGTRTLNSSAKMTSKDDNVFRCRVTWKDPMEDRLFSTVSAPVQVDFAIISQKTPKSYTRQNLAWRENLMIPCMDPTYYAFSPPDLEDWWFGSWLAWKNGRDELVSELGASSIRIGHNLLLFSPPKPHEVTFRNKGKTESVVFGCFRRVVQAWVDLPHYGISYSINMTGYESWNSSRPSKLLSHSRVSRTVTQGSPVIASCLFSASPTGFPKVIWEYPPFSVTKVVYPNGNDHREVIRFIAQKSMTYECRAESVVKKFEVTVLPTLKPSDAHSMNDKYVGLRAGRTTDVTFNCELSPAPPTGYTWFSNGQKVTSADQGHWAISPSGEELTAVNVVEGRVGGVACAAHKDGGEYLKNARLFVYGDPQIEISHTVSQSDPSFINIVAGDSPPELHDGFNVTVTFNPTALSGGRVSARWFKTNMDATVANTFDGERGVTIRKYSPTGSVEGPQGSTIEFTPYFIDAHMNTQDTYQFEVRYTDCDSCDEELTYRSNEIVISVKNESAPVPDAHVEKTEPFPFYIIGIVVGVLTVATVVGLALFWGRRNRRNDYYVRDEEVKVGANKNTGDQFKDFQRPEDKPDIRGSDRGSLIGSHVDSFDSISSIEVESRI